MFASDFNTAWRGAVPGADLTAQIPFGYTPVTGIPYGYGLGMQNFARIPFPGALAQTPFLSPYYTGMPMLNPMLANTQVGAIPMPYAYAVAPYGIGAWGIPQGFPGAIWR